MIRLLRLCCSCFFSSENKGDSLQPPSGRNNTAADPSKGDKINDPLLRRKRSNTARSHYDTTSRKIGVTPTIINLEKIKREALNIAINPFHRPGTEISLLYAKRRKWGGEKAIVYRHQLDGTAFAVKMVPAMPPGREIRTVKRDKEKSMLQNEIDLLRPLQNRHKHIIQIINLKDEHKCEHPILVMHYYPHTIEDVIRRPDIKIASTFFNDTADALIFLQENHILHNDIKPANILLTDKGKPVLADFGLAQYSHEAKPKHLRGTRGYMSPEMKSRYKTHGFKSDQWSLTIVWLEVLYHRHLFTDKMLDTLYKTDENSIFRKGRTYKTFESHISHQLIFIETQLREVNEERPDLYAFFKRATQKDPEERPSLPELLTSIKGLVS